MKPLDCIAKRDLLAAAKFDADTVRACAEDYLQSGRLGEAFEFFRKIADRSGVTRVRDAGVGEGEPEVLWRIEKSFPDLMPREEWLRCAEAALAMEKPRCAAYVYEHLHDAERLAAVQMTLTPAEAPPAAPPPSAG